jgi:putative lipoic acid-binding regulatory protein
MASKTVAPVALLLFLTLLCFTFVSCDSLASTVDNTARKRSSFTKTLIDQLQPVEDALISFEGNVTNPLLKEAVEGVIRSLSWLIKELEKDAGGTVADLQSNSSLPDIIKSVLGALSGLIKELIQTPGMPDISMIGQVLEPLLDTLISLIKVFAPQDQTFFKLLQFLSDLMGKFIKKVAIVAPQHVGQLKPINGSLALLIKALAA